MNKVRELLPKRRTKPTKSPTGTKWSQHKPDLREDFNFYCGYCGSFDGFRHTYFEVDHFIPKSFFKKYDNIRYCDYFNLVYSCKFCNNKKLNLWPSQREDVFSINNEGFIDPCDEEYDRHLFRTEEGGIMWTTPLGKWMATVAFKFDERDYSIKLLWELDQIRKLFIVFAEELKRQDKGSVSYQLIKAQANELGFQYTLYHNELMKYYNSL